MSSFRQLLYHIVFRTKDSRPTIKPENAEQLYGTLKNIGYQLGPQPGPIVAIILDNPEQALAMWNGLMTANIYVNLILPPAAPEGKSLVRCSINAAHTPEQINYVSQVLAELYAKLH